MYEEKGYLVGDFKVFYLEEVSPREVEYHYHRFDKLLVFLSGSVEYAVEGKGYTLLPGDMVLVPRGTSHKVKPVWREGEAPGYTRLVVYISPQYLSSLPGEGECLRTCFQSAEEQRHYVIRPRESGGSAAAELTAALKESVRAGDADCFSQLHQRTLLLQLLILLNRNLRDGGAGYVNTSRCNEKIVSIVCYINSHLADHLSLDELAERFYLSKYHMMRQFKAETGYTIGEYINQKRLLNARELLKQGQPVTGAYLDSGFREHSTFVRAYKKMFGEMPSKTKR